VSDPKKADEVPFKRLVTGAIAGAVAVAVVLLCAKVLFGLDAQYLGQSADAFGGYTNPLLTFITFLGVLYTIKLQQTELRETRAEAKRQADASEVQGAALQKTNFENTFFEMLKVFIGIGESVSIMKNYNGEWKAQRGRENFIDFQKHIASERKKAPEWKFEDIYETYWSTELGKHMSHYYRYLLTLLLFVEHSSEQPDLYMDIIASQMTDHELALLSYRAMAEDDTPFLPFLEKYAMLTHMPPAMILH
jgi:hypothetical protein